MAGFLLRCPPDLRERPGNGPELLAPGVWLAALLSGRSEKEFRAKVRAKRKDRMTAYFSCWYGAGMVVVAVVLVERLMAREKRRQELRLRAAVQNKTSKPLPTPERACPGEVKPKPPPAGPTREMYQVS